MNADLFASLIAIGLQEDVRAALGGPFMSPVAAHRAGGQSSPATHVQSPATLATPAPATESPLPKASIAGQAVASNAVSDTHAKLKGAISKLKEDAKTGKKDPCLLLIVFI